MINAVGPGVSSSYAEASSKLAFSSNLAYKTKYAKFLHFASTHTTLLTNTLQRMDLDMDIWGNKKT